MELQQFGLRHPPLGTESTELWEDAYFAERDRSFRVIVTGGEMLHG